MNYLCFPSVILVLTCSTLWADSIELVGGGLLRGQAERRGDLVIISVDDEIQVAVPKSRVRRVVQTKDLVKYQALAGQVGEDAQAHYQLARWCVAPGNVPGLSQHYKRFHMQRAVELDPDHAEARASLGYTKDNGKWVRKSNLMRDRGMISQGGRWVIPEAVALEEVNDSSNKKAKKWIREVSKLVGIVMRGRQGKKYEESLQALEAIRDPLAAGAIAQQFSRSRAANPRSQPTQSLPLRRLWVQRLGQFKNGISVRALVEAGIREHDASLREMALDHLVQYGSGSAVATYMGILRSKKSSNGLINQAARALTWFPDREMAMEYVNSLVTTHTRESAASGSLNATFSDEGGGGLTSGSKKRIVKETKNNASVLALVKTVIPEVDFGYDEAKWRNYIARQKNAYDGDLRRDRP